MPFEKIKNKVIFVNPEVNIPLKLEEGKETPLGFKLKLAQKAFEKTAEYDRKISQFLKYGRVF